MTAAIRTNKASSGARFYRCALQVNPHHYADTFRGEPAPGDALAYARQVVGKALDERIEVLAITDHNSAADVATFRVAAEGTAIHILPGFELSSQEGVHVLCIYPPDTNEDQLDSYLGEFGIRDPDPSSDLADKSLSSTWSGSFATRVASPSRLT